MTRNGFAKSSSQMSDTVLNAHLLVEANSFIKVTVIVINNIQVKLSFVR